MRVEGNLKITCCGGDVLLILFPCVVQHARVTTPSSTKESTPGYCVQLLNTFQQKGKACQYVSFAKQQTVWFIPVTEDCCFLGCHAMWFYAITPTFQRNCCFHHYIHWCCRQQILLECCSTAGRVLEVAFQKTATFGNFFKNMCSVFFCYAWNGNHDMRRLFQFFDFLADCWLLCYWGRPWKLFGRK